MRPLAVASDRTSTRDFNSPWTMAFSLLSTNPNWPNGKPLGLLGRGGRRWTVFLADQSIPLPMQQCLYFLPLPQGHLSLREIFCSSISLLPTNRHQPRGELERHAPRRKAVPLAR